MNKLALVIPGLLGPLPELEQYNKVSPDCAVLQKWLACAQTVKTASRNYYQLLAELFGINQDYSIALLSARVDDCRSSQGHWLRADPVHFKADIDHAILLDCNRLDIRDDEARALAAAFNEHFSDDGIELVVGHRHRWYLSFDKQMNIQTTSVHDAVGRNVNHFLPMGEDALNWRRLLNETQMLFHTHDVNVEREKKGQMTINSLWIWGEGNDLQADNNSQWDWLMSNEVTVNGLALGLGIKSILLDTKNDELQLPEGNGVMVLDQLIGPTSYGDVSAWVDAVEMLCQQWFDVLHRLLKSKQIQSLELYSADGRMFKLTASSLLKFWCRKQSIARYVSAQ
ncbi:MAG: hypothetical protein OQK70_12170 [Gammaproteobacteria bacterium]|nr:hypothetical protein [Gammaproteobacteria bacterium]